MWKGLLLSSNVIARYLNYGLIFGKLNLLGLFFTFVVNKNGLVDHFRVFAGFAPVSLSCTYVHVVIGLVTCILTCGYLRINAGAIQGLGNKKAKFVYNTHSFLSSLEPPCFWETI